MPDRSPYDTDPNALAWARAKVQDYIDHLADFERQAKEKRDPATATGCAVSRLLAQRHFLGDGGCVIGAFDERRPGLSARPAKQQRPYACRNCRRPLHWSDATGWLHDELPQYAHEPITCERPHPVCDGRPGCDHGDGPDPNCPCTCH